MSSFFKDIREIVDPKFELSEDQIVSLVEEKFTSTNNARVEICPDCDNGVLAEGSMMERPCLKCGGTGKLSPVA